MINDAVLLNEWHVVARSAELLPGQPLAARLLDEDIVLWRSGDQVLAWQDLCIHRGAKLSLGKVEGERLICPYHGWVYNEEGKCVLIPAHPEQIPPERARAQAYRALDLYGWVWVTLGNPTHLPPAFAEWDDSGFRNIHCGPYFFKAGAPRVIENFLDVAHFPFVHEGYLGDPQHTEISDYDAIIAEDGVTADNIRVWQPDPDGLGVGKHVAYTYRVMRPLVAYFVKRMEQTFSIYFVVTPVSEFESKGGMWMNYNYGFDIPEEELRAFQATVAGQDVPIVESQRPERLPLDLQAELHLRSDRTAIAYRKWLRQLGLSFGTA
ncbi:MAG: aromatic ring-hydroxylating dioxygenase subunit alpha [Chloroflexi bacterium]|uniref:aromatic ring-hydroxylating dioxygenase subunit alpha n=1 Tax=Candidatus Flexifilum breve TaxID=3140694 RepID=UPI0031364843|nr:aromatic ring-hydroxylating dioxygenase subunit alpha [Chloroflexota bacterium]